MNVRSRRALLVGLAFVLSLVMFVAARADHEDHLGPYRLLTTISIPGNLAGGFDIGWVDSEAGRYYLADRGVAA
jgi:hypothetical protein